MSAIMSDVAERTGEPLTFALALAEAETFGRAYEINSTKEERLKPERERRWQRNILRHRDRHSGR